MGLLGSSQRKRTRKSWLDCSQEAKTRWWAGAWNGDLEESLLKSRQGIEEEAVWVGG